MTRNNRLSKDSADSVTANVVVRYILKSKINIITKRYIEHNNFYYGGKKMCGIVGYVGKKKALPILIDGLSALEYRGYDSAGIAFVKENKVEIIREKGKIADLEALIDFQIETNIGMGHTRWATHGEPNIINAHPHQVGNITLIHNGIIENYEEIKEELIRDGYNFKSETDTEVAAALIDKLYSKHSDIYKALDEAKTLVRGSYAFGIMLNDDLDALYAVRKDSPLIIAFNEDDYYMASDVPAILKYTNQYYLIDNNEIVTISKSGFRILDSDMKEITKEMKIFEGDLHAAEKNGFDHFMLKEIHEESEVIQKTIFPYIEGGIDNLITKMPDLVKYTKIDIVACGSAYHTGLIGKSLIEKYANVPCNVEIASEYRYNKIFFNEKTLVILVSQSGETADTLACLRIAKENGMDTLAIVNVVGSSIAREAKYVLYIKAGCEIAVATTKAYSAQLAMFALIALNIGVKNNSIDDFTVLKVMKDATKLPEYVKELTNRSYKDVALEIYVHNDIFFLGRGIDYPIAMEGSLKLKEISYIHSEAYAAGELKHGTISLVKNGTPIISIVTNKYLSEKSLSNIKEVKSRGARTYLITTDELDRNFDSIDVKIVIPEVHEMLQSILSIIPLQLIAYEVAKLRDCDIDKPRNLAKSVTVE